YYAVKGYQSGSINEPTTYTTDLLNLIVPTQEVLVGGHAAHGISQHFPSNDSERDGYLGIPVLLMFVLYAVRRWRTAAGRLLLACFAVGLIASFGVWLAVDRSEEHTSELQSHLNLVCR